MLIEMKDICKDYLQGREMVPVLRDVNLQVEEGDYLAIMGPSASRSFGCATIARAIATRWHCPPDS